MKMIKRTIPVSLRRKLSSLHWRLIRSHYAWNTANPMIMNSKYAEDGILTNHIPAFLEDSKFIDSYSLGVSTGALNNHRGGLSWRAYLNVKFAEHCLSVTGDFVECGVGKGLYSITICDYLGFEESEKNFYLFDTFSGIPIQQLSDAEINTAIKFNEKAYSGKYFEEVKNTFGKYTNVHLIEGQLPESLERVHFPRGIAYLQVDLNNANAEVETLRRLLKLCNKGAIVVLDDFAYGSEFETARKMISDFTNSNNYKVIVLPTGQGVILL
jgi:hypothetical protein